MSKLLVVFGCMLRKPGVPVQLLGALEVAYYEGPATDLRRVLIHDQADRDAVVSQLLRFRDGPCDDWADIIDC